MPYRDKKVFVPDFLMAFWNIHNSKIVFSWVNRIILKQKILFQNAGKYPKQKKFPLWTILSDKDELIVEIEKLKDHPGKKIVRATNYS